MCKACKWLVVFVALMGAPRLPAQQPRLDPAVWGSDHVGQPAASFTSGDECLFCHRMDVGPSWPKNRHGQTVRDIQAPHAAVEELEQLPRLKDFVREIELLMGHKNRQRFLKRSTDHGRLDLLSVEWIPSKQSGDGRLAAIGNPHWDTKVFGARCAGCHASGVDSRKQTFAAISLDCFVCHGEPAEKHTTEGSLVFLSPKRNDSAVVVTSICAQCHLRTGTSKSSGRPYPNNFIAGDNLFRDFQVDLSDPALEKLNPADRHVQENVRDVVLLGRDRVTCLSCHDVHKQSSQKHHTVVASGICVNCHGSGSKKVRKTYEVHSATCGY
jgi:hypothetical protein